MGEALLCRCQEFDSLGGYRSTGVLMSSPAVSRAGDRSITTRGAVLSPAHDEISLSGLQICRLFSRPAVLPVARPAGATAPLPTMRTPATRARPAPVREPARSVPR